MTRCSFRSSLAILALAGLLTASLPADTWARAGGGMSSGSRGTRSYSSPSRTYSAPSPSTSPSTRPTPAPAPMAQPAPAGGFLRSMAGGHRGGSPGRDALPQPGVCRRGRRRVRRRLRDDGSPPAGRDRLSDLLVRSAQAGRARGALASTASQIGRGRCLRQRGARPPRWTPRAGSRTGTGGSGMSGRWIRASTRRRSGSGAPTGSSRSRRPGCAGIWTSCGPSSPRRCRGSSASRSTAAKAKRQSNKLENITVRSVELTEAWQEQGRSTSRCGSSPTCWTTPWTTPRGRSWTGATARR